MWKRSGVMIINKFCPKCGNELKKDAKFCGGCGYDLSKIELEQKQLEKEIKKEIESKWKKQPSIKNTVLIVAEILLVLGGIIGFLTGFHIFSLDIDTIAHLIQQEGLKINVEQLQHFLTAFATIEMFLSIFPIIGGILIFRRKSYIVSSICAIIGLFTISPFFVSSIFSLIGLIFIIKSKKDFR